MHPWYDRFSLVLGPLVVLVQLGALFVRRPRPRWTITVACAAAIGGMLAYILSVDRSNDDGFDSGSPFMLLEAAASAMLLVVALLREALGRLVARGRPA